MPRAQKDGEGDSCLIDGGVGSIKLETCRMQTRGQKRKQQVRGFQGLSESLPPSWLTPHPPRVPLCPLLSWVFAGTLPSPRVLLDASHGPSSGSESSDAYPQLRVGAVN